jgi:catechol 2,3-dioxygenase-like lactoylglutathione lyase family enzyme
VAEFRVWTRSVRFDDSVAFYGDVLGREVHLDWDGPHGRGVIFRVADGLVEIEEVLDGSDAGAVQPANVALAVETDDLDHWHDRLAAAGVPIVEPLTVRPWGHRNFAVHDPNGLQLWFFEKLGDEDG